MESAHLIRPGDGPYPPSLARIPDPPAELRVRGVLGEGVRRVAIVGARDPDEYGETFARDIASGLARAGISVVSGGARGVDAAAHRGALAAGGHTVAVLGTGIDVCYPAEHRGLYEEIVAAGGAILTELPDGAGPRREHFPARNRIVSGLSEAVLVIQARAKSGALITADWARRQGVPVFALPGDARDELSEGPLALLRAGARAVASAADLLEDLGVAPAAPAQRPLPLLGPQATALLGALSRRPLHADVLARSAGLTPGAALAGLLSLELEGLCEQRPGHYFLRRNERGI